MQLFNEFQQNFRFKPVNAQKQALPRPRLKRKPGGKNESAHFHPKKAGTNILKHFTFNFLPQNVACPKLAAAVFRAEITLPAFKSKTVFASYPHSVKPCVIA